MSYSYNNFDLNPPLQQSFAVVIYLPPTIEDFVIPLREKYDPDWNLVAAHISVVFPFQTDRPLDEVTGAVQAVTSECIAFPVGLSSVGDFYPDVPLIYWGVDSCAEIHSLYRNLYVKLDLPLPYKEYIPHITVGREISHHRVVIVKDKVAAYLPRETFTVRAVDLVAPVGAGRWVSVRTFPLAERGPGS